MLIPCISKSFHLRAQTSPILRPAVSESHTPKVLGFRPFITLSSIRDSSLTLKTSTSCPGFCDGRRRCRGCGVLPDCKSLKSNIILATWRMSLAVLEERPRSMSPRANSRRADGVRSSAKGKQGSR